MTPSILTRLEEGGSRFAVRGWDERTPAERLERFFGEPHLHAPIVYQEGRVRNGVGADVLAVLKALQDGRDG